VGIFSFGHVFRRLKATGRAGKTLGGIFHRVVSSLFFGKISIKTSII